MSWQASSSGFLDKAREAAQQVVREAQNALAQGQQALDEWQVRRITERLLDELGAAFYAEQRAGGPREPVDAALRELDDHVQQYGWVGFPPRFLPAGSPVWTDATDESAGEQPSHPAQPETPPTGPIGPTDGHQGGGEGSGVG